MTLAAVSFDADDTLWDFGMLMRRALGYVLEELHLSLPGPSATMTVERMIAIRDRVAAARRGQAARMEDIRLEAFGETVRACGPRDDDLAARLNAIYFARRFQNVRLYPDVLPTLQALGSRYALGLVSNGNSDPARCGLAGRFQFVVFAQDHGVEKPDPALFQVALRQVGCRPDQMLHVGDSLENDVLGAARAGLRTAWLNRSGAPNSTGIRPGVEIRSLAELPGVCDA